MSLDPSKITVVSAKKVDPVQLSTVGDSVATVSKAPAPKKLTQASEQRCNLCCVAYGSIIDAVMVIFLTSALTGIAIYAEKRVNYSINGVVRQITWLSIPGILVGCSVHYFLSEAMWSGKKNSWGQAWAKAMVLNAVVWGAGVGACTLTWRKLLPLTAAGRRLYYRYPIPTEPLEWRLLRSGREFFRGMGWSYWLGGLASGNLGLLTVVAFCVYNDRPHMMMAPDGKYATLCMPPWRRQQLALMANVPTTAVAAAEGGTKGYLDADGITTGRGIEIGFKDSAPATKQGGRSIT